MQIKKLLSVTILTAFAAYPAMAEQVNVPVTYKMGGKVIEQKTLKMNIGPEGITDKGQEVKQIDIPAIINSQPQKSLTEEMATPVLVPADKDKKINSRPVIFNSLFFDTKTAEKLEKAHDAYSAILATRQLDDAGGNLRSDDIVVKAIEPALPPPIRQVYLGSIIYNSPTDVSAWVNERRYKVGDTYKDIQMTSAGPDRVELVYNLSKTNFNFDDARVGQNSLVKVDKEKKELTFALMPNHRLDLDFMKILAGKSYTAQKPAGFSPVGEPPKAPTPIPGQMSGQMRGQMGQGMQRPGVSFPAPLGTPGTVGGVMNNQGRPLGNGMTGGQIRGLSQNIDGQMMGQIPSQIPVPMGANQQMNNMGMQPQNMQRQPNMTADQINQAQQNMRGANQQMNAQGRPNMQGNPQMNAQGRPLQNMGNPNMNNQGQRPMMPQQQMRGPQNMNPQMNMQMNQQGRPNPQGMNPQMNMQGRPNPQNMNPAMNNMQNNMQRPPNAPLNAPRNGNMQPGQGPSNPNAGPGQPPAQAAAQAEQQLRTAAAKFDEKTKGAINKALSGKDKTALAQLVQSLRASGKNQEAQQVQNYLSAMNGGMPAPNQGQNQQRR